VTRVYFAALNTIRWLVSVGKSLGHSSAILTESGHRLEVGSAVHRIDQKQFLL
jgi:hypothetical protein